MRGWRKSTRAGLAVLLLALVAAGAFALGRATAARPTANGATANGATANGATANGATANGATANGATANGATANDPGYAAGLAEGIREGRTEQATVNLPATDQQVFDAGYTAGAADAFGTFDGGWDRGTPYVIVLAPGGPGVTYRVTSRTRLAPGVDYYLCPDGHTLCQQPR